MRRRKKERESQTKKTKKKKRWRRMKKKNQKPGWLALLQITTNISSQDDASWFRNTQFM